MKASCGKNNTGVLQKSLPCVAFMVKVALIFSSGVFRAAKTDRLQRRAARPASFLPPEI
jgi:hypothetical protein